MILPLTVVISYIYIYSRSQLRGETIGKQNVCLEKDNTILKTTTTMFCAIGSDVIMESVHYRTKIIELFDDKNMNKILYKL